MVMMNRFLSPLHSPRVRRRRGRPYHGQALVEFALAATIFLLLLFGILQYGYVYYTMGSINNAAREGARYGSVHPSDVPAIKNIVKGRSALRFTDNDIQVTFPDGNSQAESRITVTVSYRIVSFFPGLKAFTSSKTSTMRIEAS